MVCNSRVRTKMLKANSVSYESVSQDIIMQCKLEGIQS
jgi:hypothetical protein